MLDKLLDDVTMADVAAVLKARYPNSGFYPWPRNKHKLWSQFCMLHRVRKSVGWMCSLHSCPDSGYPVKTVRDVLDYMTREADSVRQSLVHVAEEDLVSFAEERDAASRELDKKRKAWYDNVKPIQITIDNGVHVMDIEIVYVDAEHEQGSLGKTTGWSWHVLQSRKCGTQEMQKNTSDSFWSRNRSPGDAMESAWTTLTDDYSMGKA